MGNTITIGIFSNGDGDDGGDFPQNLTISQITNLSTELNNRVSIPNLEDWANFELLLTT